MTQLILLLISAALVNNVVLSRFLGLCPFLGVSKKTETSVGMGAAVIFVITLSSMAASLIYTHILIPLKLVEMVLKKNMPSLYEALGVYLPLITTNCAVLGVALDNVAKEYNFAQSLVYGVGTASGFALAIVLLSGVREKIENNDIPHVVSGMPIVLITAGLMAIAFTGFSGLI